MGVAVLYVPVVAGVLLFSSADVTRHVGHHDYLRHTNFFLHDMLMCRHLCALFRFTGVFDEPQARRPCCPDRVDSVAKVTCAAVGLSSLLKGKT